MKRLIALLRLFVDRLTCDHEFDLKIRGELGLTWVEKKCSLCGYSEAKRDGL